MIELLFNIILIFLYYLICICIYILYNNRKNKKIVKSSIPIKIVIEDKIKDEIRNFKDNKPCNIENINYIMKKINNKKYEKEVIKILLKFKDRETIIKFANSINLLNSILSKKDKDEYDKSYKIYVIGEFKNKSDYNYLVENCDDKSSFVQINALKALAKLGNENYFVDGLVKIMSSSSLIHDKVISDNIYSLSINNNKINNLLLSKIKNVNDDFQKIIIHQFSTTNFEQAKDSIYKLLKNEETDFEVKIACIKYFMNVKYDKIQNLLLDLLKNEAWEIRALTATALKSYKSEMVISKLKESIKDPVWYVRQNSAKSLHSLIKDENELLNIINGQDRYASDAIKSILSENDKEKYNFISRVSKVYKEKDVFEEENIKEGQLIGSLQC